MAAETLIASTKRYNTRGRYKEVQGEIDSLDDGNTLAVPGLSKVVGAHVEPRGTDVVAADSVNVASISGRTITFEAGGTARRAFVVAWGY